MNPKWHCPICNNHTPYYSLQVDAFILNIVEMATELEIECDLDGNWQNVKKERHISSGGSRLLSNKSINSLSLNTAAYESKLNVFASCSQETNVESILNQTICIED
jgi:hypothetical protein